MSGAINSVVDSFMGRDVVQRERGLRALPGNDNLLELADLIRDPPAWFHDHFERYGRVFRTRMLVGTVFMIGAEANRTIMLTRRTEFGFGAGYEQTNVSKVFKGSIMMLDGEEHDHLRKILNPAVGRLAVRESGGDIQKIWRQHFADGSIAENLDAYTFGCEGTFTVAANKLTGLELGMDAKKFAPHMNKIINGIMQSIPIRVPGSPLDQAMKARDAVIAMLKPRIEEARLSEPQGLVGQLAHYKDEQGNYMPSDELAAHLIMLFWAGYDTTASATSWVFHHLARRPDWQRRLREELLALEPGDLGALEKGRATPQLEWFLYEVERYTPSVVMFPRIALVDIDYEGFRIPEGTPIFYSPYMSHRDPGSFKNPNCFDPDRWDPALGKERARASDLVGFGGGPRICLGKAFAKLQLKIMIYELLTRYHIEVDERTAHTVMGLPIHHPVNSSIRIRRLSS